MHRKIAVFIIMLMNIPMGCLLMEGNSIISGTVTDGNGTRIEGVTITSDPEIITTDYPGREEEAVTAKTDANGRYVLVGAKRGSYTITASSGSNTASVKVIVKMTGMFSMRTESVGDIQLEGEVEEPPEEPPVEVPDEIQWYYTYAEGVAAAQQSGKPKMIDFYADWCYWCGQLDQNTYPDEQVRAKSVEFVCVKVDCDVETDIADDYNITALPTIVFTTSAETEVHRFLGYKAPAAFLNEMNTALGQM